MDEIQDQYQQGRRAMINAFADMTALAYRAAYDGALSYDEVLELHGRFFDGNVMVKRAFIAAVLLAETRRRRLAGGHDPGAGA
jgi:hypothetical protein